MLANFLKRHYHLLCEALQGMIKTVLENTLVTIYNVEMQMI